MAAKAEIARLKARANPRGYARDALGQEWTDDQAELVRRFGLDLARFKVAADVTQVKALQDNREQLHKIADASFNAGWLDRAGAKKLAKFGKVLPEDKGVYKTAAKSPDEAATDKLKEDLAKTYEQRRLMFEAMATEFDVDTEETV